MIAIIDYNMGNIRSLGNALSRLGAEWELTSNLEKIMKASHLPEVIWKLRHPVLGICVGMQVMCRTSEEGNAECMGIFDAHVKRFKEQPGIKVPHMGWSRISNLESKLFKGIDKGAYVYFVHSYYAPLCPDTIATARHPEMFSAALKYENFYGSQFHPEKSGPVGEQILRNFLSL